MEQEQKCTVLSAFDDFNEKMIETMLNEESFCIERSQLLCRAIINDAACDALVDLLQKGANVTKRFNCLGIMHDVRKRSALGIAAYYLRFDVVECFVNRGLVDDPTDGYDGLMERMGAILQDIGEMKWKHNLCEQRALYGAQLDRAREILSVLPPLTAAPLSFMYRSYGESEEGSMSRTFALLVRDANNCFEAVGSRFDPASRQQNMTPKQMAHRNGCIVDVEGSVKGRTPLMMIAQHLRCPETMQLLCRLNARLDVCDGRGFNPLSMAFETFIDKLKSNLHDLVIEFDYSKIYEFVTDAATIIYHTTREEMRAAEQCLSTLYRYSWKTYQQAVKGADESVRRAGAGAKRRRLNG